MKTLLQTLAAALLLATAPVARAQDMSAVPAMQNAYMSSHIANLALSSTLESNRREGIDSNTGLKKGIVVGRPGSAAARGTTAGLGYGAPSAALKASTVRGYVTRLKTKNPAAAQAVADNFGSGKYDYGTIYRGIIAGQGLRENDAADATAALLIIGWMIVNDVRDGKSITVPMAQGVRNQFAPKLAANAQLAAPGVPAQLGEEMKLLFVVVQGGWQAAIRENTLPAYQQGIGSMFKNQYGLDLTLVKLSSQGFAKR